jgi:protein-S-isoprenylcysteine O-methyltransferase Ste14
MIDLLALITIILWPVIPIFWIPVHLMTSLFRRLGILTYLVSLILWIPLAYIIYQNRSFILGFNVTIPLILKTAGWFLFAVGLLLHLWTGRLLSLKGLIGLPELSDNTEGRLVTNGAFSIVRHPTYVAHTMIFSGIFLITGFIVVGIITVIDLIFVLALIIPIEEKELINRFGEKYIEYKERVPRFIPFKRYRG